MNHLYHKFLSEPFAITTGGAVKFQSRFSYTVPAATQPQKNFFGDTIRTLEWRDGVALIPVDGILIKSAGFLDVGYGARAHETISADLAAALEKNPKAIVLLMDSPGGSVNGTPELSAEISAAAKRVPVFAFCDSVCASAAFWICAGAKIYATPSAQIGCIGAILQFTTFARALEAQGIDVHTLTSSGANVKGAGNPLKAVTQAEQEYLQSHVNTAGQMFNDAVLAARPGISADAFSGACNYASGALRLGVIDAIVSSLGEVFAKIGGQSGPGSINSRHADDETKAAIEKLSNGEVPLQANGKNRMAVRPVQLKFNPLPNRPGQTAIYTPGSLAKRIGCTASDISALIKSGSLPIIKSTPASEQFEVEIADINRLLTKNKI